MTAWREAFDAEGRTYYYDEVTGDTTWDEPAAFKKADELSDEEEEEEAAVGEPEEAEGEEDEAPRWCRAFDEAKQMSYYYHTGTNEVTWSRPEGYAEGEDEGEGDGESLEPEGYRAADDASYDGGGGAASEDGEMLDEDEGGEEGPESAKAGTVVAAAAARAVDTPAARLAAEGPAAEGSAAAPTAPAVDPLAAATAKLDELDAIMETDVVETIKVAIGHGGDPAEMIPKLFAGYQGFAAMAGLVAEWTAEFATASASLPGAAAAGATVAAAGAAAPVAGDAGAAAAAANAAAAAAALDGATERVLVAHLSALVGRQFDAAEADKSTEAYTKTPTWWVPGSTRGNEATVRLPLLLSVPLCHLPRYHASFLPLALCLSASDHAASYLSAAALRQAQGPLQRRRRPSAPRGPLREEPRQPPPQILPRRHPQAAGRCARATRPACGLSFGAASWSTTRAGACTACS
jgi:hypothetical protein